MTTQCILGNTRRPDISFFTSGKIDISSRIVKALNIQKGDVINIMVDRGEYYLYVSAQASEVCGRHEASCYPTNNGSRHFRTHSRRLCSVILQAAGVTGCAAFAAGEVIVIGGRSMIPIITRHNLARQQ